MIQFYETVMGKRFFEGTVPSLVRALERIANALETTPSKKWVGGCSLIIQANDVDIEIDGSWDKLGEGHYGFHDKKGRLLSIFGCDVHLEAVAIQDKDSDPRVAVNEDLTDTLDALYVIHGQEPHQTVTINGVECELFMVPAG